MGEIHFYEEGERGVDVVLRALKEQAIENLHFSKIEVIPGDLQSAMINRVNGDIEFINSLTYAKEFIEVKNGNWISIASLRGFRRDGWLLLNAFYPSRTIMIRNTEDAISQIVSLSALKYGKTGDPGYRIILENLDQKRLEFKNFDQNLFDKIKMEEIGRSPV